MSTPHLRDNGWYCDCLPSGAFVRLVRDTHLETQHGTVPLPNGQNLLFVTLHPNGTTFAGVGNQDDQCWEWNGQSWDSHGNAFGMYSVIYDREGTLWVIRGYPGVGYRYVDEQNQLVTAEDTYAHPRLPIWGYTSLFGGNLIIGQGGRGEYVYPNGDPVHGEDPCIAILGTTTYLLMPGQCRHIRARMEGQRIALAFVREDANAAVTWFTSLDEITQHAVITRKNVVIPPIPVPEPEPEPIPVPEPAFPVALLLAFAAKFPLPQGQPGEEHENNCRAWSLTFAEQVRFSTGDERWGVKRAAGPQSKDTIAYNHDDGSITVFDLMAGAGTGAPVLNPQPHGERVTGQTFIPVVAVDHLDSTLPIPGPIPPTPGPTPIPSTEVLKRLADLSRRVERMEQAGFVKLGDLIYKP
jgi:hypothetical protein